MGTVTGKMQLEVDDHLKSVMEFMQSNIPASKLIGVADNLPQMARLLWGRYPQEPVVGASLLSEFPAVSTACETQPTATV